MDAAAIGLAAGAVLSGLGSFLAAASSMRRRAADERERELQEMLEAIERMKLEREHGDGQP